MNQVLVDSFDYLRVLNRTAGRLIYNHLRVAFDGAVLA